MSTATKPGSVFILDDDQSVRAAYQRVLTDAGYISFGFDSFEKLRSHMAYAQGPDDQICLLLDMKLPGTTRLEVQRWLLDQKSRMAVVFVSGQSHIEEAISAMRAGAVDFLLKPVGEDQLIAAVDGALNSAPTEEDESLPSGFESLTHRESQVMTLVVKGLRSQQIADELGITLRTVKMHRGNIMNKVNVANVAQLVAMYQERRYARA